MRIIAVAIAALPSLALAQIPTKVLSKPEVELAEAFSEINSVQELGDGRVLVVNTTDRVVLLCDLRTGRAQRVGRVGNGPGEYRFPVQLIPLGDGRFGIVDEATRRIQVVLDDGKTGPTIRLTPPSGVGDDWGPGTLQADGRGRMYAAREPYRMVDGKAVRVDSVPILRWTPGQPRSDVVAWVRRQAVQVSSSTRGKAVSIGIGVNPFVAQDEWAVGPDGRVAVVDAEKYQVHWTDPSGNKTVTPPIPFTPLRFTEAHKQEWREQQAGGMVTMINGDDGSVTTRPAKKQVEEPPWPDYLGPFHQRGLLVEPGPGGRLWVWRHGPARSAPTYDLIDGSGRVILKVELPPRSRLLGFGANGAIYLARVDQDDLEYLQRYRLP